MRVEIMKCKRCVCRAVGGEMRAQRAVGAATICINVLGTLSVCVLNEAIMSRVVSQKLRRDVYFSSGIRHTLLEGSAAMRC